MKPRADQSPFSSYLEEPRPEAASSESASAQTRQQKTARSGFGFDAACLSLIGIGCVVCGVLLALSPRLSWKLSQIADGFKDLGIQAGVLVMGGLILAALGLLRRGQIVLRTPTTEQLEDRLLLEQLTKDSLRACDDFARMETDLARLESELEVSRREAAEKIAMAAREVIAAIPPPPEIPTPDEAIFRLAASLDQVGMRIEQRLKTQYTALQDHLEDVGAAILSARNQMQGLGQGEDRSAQLREEVQAQVESALEETGFWVDGQPAIRPPSLGVLDTIDADSTPRMPELGSVDSALPLNPEEAREHGASTARAASRDEFDAKTRLIQLSTLLADPKLLKALEGISNSDS